MKLYYNCVHGHVASRFALCSSQSHQIKLQRLCCPAYAVYGRVPARTYSNVRAAVSVRPEEHAFTPDANTKPSVNASRQQQAVHHLRKLATAARRQNLSLSQARNRTVLDLLAVAGLSRVAGSSVDALGGQDLADLLWAMAALGEDQYFKAEMEAVLQVVDFKQHDFKMANLLDVLWSLGISTHWTPKLGDLIAKVLLLGGLKGIETSSRIASLLYTLAVLDFNPPDLFAEGLPTQRVASFRPHQVITACWSLCVLQETQSGIFQTLWRELGVKPPSALHMTQSMASQLVQIKMSVTEGHAALDMTDTHDRIFEEAERRWKKILETDYFSMSAPHADMCRALKSMGVDYVVEDISSGYAIDIAIPSLKIAVEVDGPAHFARNSKRRLGPSAMKHRHLSQRGWQVFSLAVVDEWATHESSREALQRLRDLIALRRGAV